MKIKQTKMVEAVFDIEVPDPKFKLGTVVLVKSSSTVKIDPDWYTRLSSRQWFSDRQRWLYTDVRGRAIAEEDMSPLTFTDIYQYEEFVIVERK